MNRRNAENKEQVPKHRGKTKKEKKMSTDEPMETTNKSTKTQTNSERAIEILEEALGGQSSKSKNSLIKDAIKALRG